jgi:hypothetical protein
MAPQIYYQTTQQTRVETAQGGKTVTEIKNETANHPLLLDGSDIKADLNLDYRQKGLLWYSTYRVRFDGKYRMTNYTDAERDIFFNFSAPNQSGVYDSTCGWPWAIALRSLKRASCNSSIWSCSLTHSSSNASRGLRSQFFAFSRSLS